MTNNNDEDKSIPQPTVLYHGVELAAEPAVYNNKGELISDESEHAAMLNNPVANRMADELAADTARELGLLTEEEVQLYIFGTEAAPGNQKMRDTRSDANIRAVKEIGVNKTNVGRIAERIVSNELEYHGFRVSDLNKEGTSVNADLLAARDGHSWQIQVKGSTEEDGWWFNYGYGTEEIIEGSEPMFNKCRNGFYRAEMIVLVCVKSPKAYSCLVLPVAIAERAAQKNLDREYRTKRRDGDTRKPGKVWVSFYLPPRLQDGKRKTSLLEEQALIEPYQDSWHAFISEKSA
jgi:hypothetical protein